MDDIILISESVRKQLLNDTVDIESIFALASFVKNRLETLDLGDDAELAIAGYNLILQGIVKSLENKDYVYLLDLLSYSLPDLLDSIA